MPSCYRLSSARVGVVIGFALALSSLALLASPRTALADFGLIPGSAEVTALNSDGTGDMQASSHPDSFTLHFDLKTNADGHSEGGELRDVLVNLPPGFVGNQAATPRCTRQEFEGIQPNCPGNTQVGVLRATLPSDGGEVFGAVYNVNPPPGVAGQLGFSAVSLNALQYASVLSEGGYGLSIFTPGIPIETTSVTETIWGTPPDPSHDSERQCRLPSGGVIVGCSSDASPLAYLTLPASCSAPLETTIEVDSNLEPGKFVGETVKSLDSSGSPSALTGCEAVPFQPKLAAQPTSRLASSPSGLDFELSLPNQGLLSPAGIAETEPVKTEVVLPQGVTINPSAANGQGVCTPAQYESATAERVPGQGCPESSKVGTLVAKTPLLEEAIEGSVYLAAPHDNPFKSLLALYIVAVAPERGVLIKQAGDVQADPATGQLTTTFDGLPPLPYSSFQFDLREGPRAPLITPQTCGTYTTTARLYPFSNPSVPTERTANFNVGSGANGGACVSNEAQSPNNPSLQAGTVTSLAGAFSPFVFTVDREDGTQRFSAITATLPEGLLGDLAGVSYCPNAQIAAAAARSGEGGGTLEQSSPSCPEASQVGVVNITAGAGSQPYPVQGKAYLAGPYKSAPLSLAIITPAIAGPFDLGTVVVRVALYIDPDTAQISAVSDPIPTILDGIPLDIRSVSLSMNRAGFTFNPTSCEAMRISGQAISTVDQAAVLSNRFQVGGCAGLPFKPTLSASTQGKASKANGASLIVKIAARPGEANIHRVNLQLPVTLPSRLTTLQKACTEAVFNANPAACPAESVIGSATAHTPILQVPLSGPAYLVSHGSAAFPDVEFVLQADERGGDIEIVLDGGTQIKKGITYSNFETVPDAPISSFETVLPTGPHSILTANLPSADNYNLCGQSLTMPTTLTGQNGAVLKQSTPIAVTGCAAAIRVTKHTVKGNAATFVVSVPAAGKLTAKGAGLTSAAKTVSAAKSVTLKVKLNKKEQTFLARHRHRKLKLRVKLQFTPKKGTKLSATTTALIG
jgi:hypothetical protein